MCGILGYAPVDPDHGLDPHVFDHMIDQMIHRGPDGRGSTHHRGVSLGHRRLSIIDLAGGAQPLISDDQRFALVCNGEIYNHKELRADLEKRGCQFKTQSDNEVILHLARFHGSALLEKLDGMFAFALHDREKDEVLLGRDPFGKKPLFFATTPFGTGFSSMIASLKALPGLDLTIDSGALHHYLSFLAVPTARSIYKGIKKLPPGHCAIIRQGKIRLSRYFSWHQPQDGNPSFEDASEHLWHLLRKSVDKRLMSDVPLGAFLSGGLDSSSVCAAMADIQPGKVQSFSVAFDRKDFDESSYAKQVADHLNIQHHQATCQAEQIDHLQKLIPMLGEPYADSSLLPTSLLCEQTRQHVTVALSGDGADEILGGYKRYQANLIAARGDRVPSPLRQALSRFLLTALPVEKEFKSKLGQARRFLRLLGHDDLERYLETLTFFNEDLKHELYTNDWCQKHSLLDSVHILEAARVRCQKQSTLEQLPEIDLQTYLVDDILVKVDVASMAHSLEVRCPFLDQELVKFCLSLPLSYRVTTRATKRLLKQSMAQRLPHHIIHRPKQGFAIPLAEWFRGPFAELYHDLVPEGLSEWMERQKLKQLIEEHQQGRCDHGTNLFTLLMLALWKDQHNAPLSSAPA